jgi:ClpP class serine protease
MACAGLRHGMAAPSLGWWDLVAALLLLALAWAVVAPRVFAARWHRRRKALLDRLEREQGARVLTLVHGKAPVSVLGVPLYRMIDMDDAEAVLRGIRRAGPDRPIDLVLHTPGGQYHASLQIARALRNHKARTRVLVPHVAMSGGTLIALGADEVVMDPDAVMGPVDPQVGDWIRGWQSTTSWVKVAQAKGKDADDITLAMADVSGKLLEGTRRAVAELVEGKVQDPGPLLERLVEGGYAHGYPLSPRDLQSLGLPVRTDFPPGVHELLASYRGSRRNPVEAS